MLLLMQVIACGVRGAGYLAGIGESPGTIGRVAVASMG
ncbi:hypothetical protein FLA_2941 [Filimonas lacunae]|nr:hypothetical protein FLA_2941 [Filimonas lacunae]